MARNVVVTSLCLLLLHHYILCVPTTGVVSSFEDLQEDESRDADATGAVTVTQNPSQPSELDTGTVDSSGRKDTTVAPESEDKPFWEAAVDRSQTVMALLGFGANIVTLATLIRNGTHFFSPTICLLLKHQSLVDSVICAMAVVILIQPSLWTTGLTWLDVFFCHAWHNQAMFWFLVLVSIWNLVLVSVERYVAVCMPFSHSSLTPRQMTKGIIVVYIASLPVLSLGLVQHKWDFDKRECLAETVIPGQVSTDIYHGYSIFWFLMIYMMPVVIHIAMYSRILYALRQRKQNMEMAGSAVIDSASNSMTKAAIALTLTFIVSIGFDAWYFMLGSTGVVAYVFNSPVQKISVFLSAFNSCVNPCVYAVLMPAYRKSLKKTFCCDKQENQPVTNTGSSRVSAGSSLTISSTM